MFFVIRRVQILSFIMHEAIVGFIFEQKCPARDALEVMFVEVEGDRIGLLNACKFIAVMIG